MGLKTVKWVDTIPPRIGGTGGMTKLARTVKRLKDNPDRWAEVASSQNQTEIRTLSSRLRSAGLQVAQRRAGGGWSKIYARFNSIPVSKTHTVKNSSKKKNTTKKK